MMTFVWLVLGMIIGSLILGVVIFNRLVRARNQAKNGFSQIDVQLKRRHDLIPNLVSSAKRYLEHEEQTLTRVIKARNHAQELQNSSAHHPESSDHMTLFAQAEEALTQALRQFSAVAEAYPELKADSIIKDLMDELTNTENRISFARQHYNDSVMFYNIEREMFPNTIISSMFGFRALTPLQFADKAAIAVAPTVDLSRVAP